MDGNDDEFLQSQEKEKKKSSKGWGNEGLIACFGYLAEFGPNKTCKKAKHNKATNTQSSNTHGFHVGASFVHPSIRSFVRSFIHSFALLSLIGTQEAIILKIKAGITERSVPTN
jgi:hypothetical protein